MAIDEFLLLDLPLAGGNEQSIASLTHDSLEVAQRFGCSFYDAIFIALAERLNTQVLTADRKLYDRLKSSTRLLLWLGELDV